MGIRFLCPTCGHKLNVKSFLAGKRGVCPHCGNGLDIPLESQIVKGGSGHAAAADAAQAAPAASPQPAPATPRPGTGSPHPPGIRSGTVEGSPSPTPDAKPLPSPREDPADAAQRTGIPIRPIPHRNSPIQAEKPIPARDSSGKAMASPVALTVPTRPLTPVQPAQAEPVPVATPAPAPVQQPDPIEESPEAIWYVRPPSGGQYGPARGDIMRKWIHEGRVSADSLVWREGWDDWLTAGEVLPALRGSVTPPIPGPSAPAAYLPSPRPLESRGPTYRHRQNSTVLAVSAVAVLGLVCVALFVTLVFVLMS